MFIMFLKYILVEFIRIYFSTLLIFSIVPVIVYRESSLKCFILTLLLFFIASLIISSISFNNALLKASNLLSDSTIKSRNNKIAGHNK